MMNCCVYMFRMQSDHGHESEGNNNTTYYSDVEEIGKLDLLHYQCNNEIHDFQLHQKTFDFCCHENLQTVHSVCILLT